MKKRPSKNKNQEADKSGEPDHKARLEILFKVITITISIFALIVSLRTSCKSDKRWEVINDPRIVFDDFFLVETAEMDIDSLSVINFGNIDPLYLVDNSKGKVIFYYSLVPIQNGRIMFVPPGTVSFERLDRVAKQRNYNKSDLKATRLVKARVALKNTGNTPATDVKAEAFYNTGEGWIKVPKLLETPTMWPQGYLSWDGEFMTDPSKPFYDSLKVQFRINYLDSDGERQYTEMSAAFMRQVMKFSIIEPDQIDK